MSAPDQAAAVVLSQLVMAADGTMIGLALAFIAVRSVIMFKATNSALYQIKEAPYVRVSDLRSVVSEHGDSNQSDDGKLVIVRGTVEAKSVVANDVLVAHDSGEKDVIVQRSQTCIYNEWKGFMGWSSDLRPLFPRSWGSWREQDSSSTRMVPFVIVEAGRWPPSEYYVNVNMDGSSHPLPLETVQYHLQPVNATSITFFQALFGHQYPVGLLHEEKILPLGKDITAVGICSSIRGIPEIKSSNSLPYFLSERTKDQMIVELAFKRQVLLWSGVVFGSLAIGILSYAAVRYWNRWKGRRPQRQTQRQNAGDVVDRQLCVICLTRRRRAAFVPCGHVVCCQRCAFYVVRDISPKCPVCRQRIYPRHFSMQ
nr:E3 ubiquitin-protein ligase SPL2 [Ipomoea batatas]